MFDIKCVYCKFFDVNDGCEKNLNEETCTSFATQENQNTETKSCENCQWFCDGECIFDLSNPLTCRRFKSK